MQAEDSVVADKNNIFLKAYYGIAFRKTKVKPQFLLC